MFILPIRRLYFKMLLFVIFFGAELIITPLCLVFSLPSQEMGWEERPQNDLFCVEWDVESCSIKL